MSSSSSILYVGLNDNFHDPSICILNSEGQILFAEATERFIQYKGAIGCPADLDFFIEKIFSYIDVSNIKEVRLAYSWNKWRHFTSKFFSTLGLFEFDDRSFTRRFFKRKGVHYSFFHLANRFSASTSQTGIGIFRYFAKYHPEVKIHKYYFRHHDCHLYNALNCSRNEGDAVGLVIDGRGEETSISFYEISDNSFKLLYKDKSKFSLGSIFSIGTSLIGYSPMKGEAWKVMGLSAYGKKNKFIYDYFRDIYRYKNGKFSTKSYILGKYISELNHHIDVNKISKEDIAYTVQLVFEEYFFKLVEHLIARKPLSKTIYISGGSALNSLAIGKLSEKGWFDKIIVPNGPADDGNAIGAACLAFNKENKRQFSQPIISFRTPYMGSEITQKTIENYVKNSELPFVFHEKPEEFAAQLLHQNFIIGWIQGKAEFGPRALGNRSILANPKYAENKDRVNSVVKFRESYRPFAPSILDEFGEDYFEKYCFTPYMEKALTFRDSVRSIIPAVVHEDGTGRLQSVTRELNPLYYSLIKSFYELSNVPIIMNTSYNVMGKPIVNDINDVMSVFFNSKIDAVFIGNYCIERSSLNKRL